MAYGSIDEIYQQLLGRAPDTGGAQYYGGLLSGGTSYDEIARQIRASDEASSYKNQQQLNQMQQNMVNLGYVQPANGMGPMIPQDLAQQGITNWNQYKPPTSTSGGLAVQYQQPKKPKTGPVGGGTIQYQTQARPSGGGASQYQQPQQPPTIPSGGGTSQYQKPPTIPSGGGTSQYQKPPTIPSGGGTSQPQQPPTIPSGGGTSQYQPPAGTVGGDAGQWQQQFQQYQQQFQQQYQQYQQQWLEQMGQFQNQMGGLLSAFKGASLGTHSPGSSLSSGEGGTRPVSPSTWKTGVLGTLANTPNPWSY